MRVCLGVLMFVMGVGVLGCMVCGFLDVNLVDLVCGVEVFVFGVCLEGWVVVGVGDVDDFVWLGFVVLHVYGMGDEV